MNLLNEGLYAHLIGNVADVTVNVLDTCCLVVVETSLESCLIDVIENDVFDTGCDKCFCNVETDTVRCAGNPGVLSFE